MARSSKTKRLNLRKRLAIFTRKIVSISIPKSFKKPKQPPIPKVVMKEIAPKRKRGRPKGSKNKPKQINLPTLKRDYGDETFIGKITEPKPIELGEDWEDITDYVVEGEASLSDILKRDLDRINSNIVDFDSQLLNMESFDAFLLDHNPSIMKLKSLIIQYPDRMGEGEGGASGQGYDYGVADAFFSMNGKYETQY